MFGWYGKKKTDRKQAHVVLAQQTHAAIEGGRCERVVMGNSVPKTGGCAEKKYVLCVVAKIKVQS